VRIFEWNGTMVHAKTAIMTPTGRASDRPTTSTADWAQNGRRDRGRGHGRRWLRTTRRIGAIDRDHPEGGAGSWGSGATARVDATAPRYGSSRRLVHDGWCGRSTGAAVTGSLEEFEITPVVGASLAFAATAGLTFYAPWIIAWPVVFFSTWIAVSLLVEAWVLWRRK
jgi:cardiolipin synthase